MKSSTLIFTAAIAAIPALGMGIPPGTPECAVKPITSAAVKAIVGGCEDAACVCKSEEFFKAAIAGVKGACSAEDTASECQSHPDMVDDALTRPYTEALNIAKEICPDSPILQSLIQTKTPEGSLASAPDAKKATGTPAAPGFAATSGAPEAASSSCSGSLRSTTTVAKAPVYTGPMSNDASTVMSTFAGLGAAAVIAVLIL
jgi:hypothetical protein